MNEQFLYDFQQPTASEISEILISNKSCLLIAPAGTGKTYASSFSIASCQRVDNKFINPAKPASVLYLCPQSNKIQNGRVFKSFGVQDFLAATYESLAKSFGNLFLDWTTKMIGGELVQVPIWKNDSIPEIIVADECQKIKNSDAVSTRIIESYIAQGGLVLFTSATPFHKVSEAKLICLALGVATKNTWKAFAEGISAPKRPDQNSPAAVKRLMDRLNETNCVVRFKNIKFAHRTFSKCKLIEFTSPAQQLRYQNAYEDYLEKRRKANKDNHEGIIARWVAMMQFRKVAEFLRTPQLAKLSFELSKEKQVIIASNFVDTLRAIWIALTKTHNLDKSQIGFIVGGQPPQQRQKFIDGFQRGKIDIILFTFKSGGAGLSLHHNNKNGRPRHVLLPPTWSAIELVQALGRGHRIDSISTTRQDVIWFKNTIEEDVAARVETKFKCLAEVVGRNETWVETFNKEADKDIEEKLKTEQKEEDEPLFATEAYENRED